MGTGPLASSCFNCSLHSYSFPDSLTDLTPALCGFGENKNKNNLCSKLLCTGPIYGIGADLGVFMRVRGEPPSVVATHELKIPASAFTTLYAKISFAAPNITAVFVNGKDCTNKPGVGCVGYAGDNVTVKATGMPKNQAVIDAYESAYYHVGGFDKPQHKPQLIKAISISLGSHPCKVVASNQSQATCTIPPNTSGGQNLRILLKVGGQSAPLPETNFTFSPPQVSGVSPNSLPSYGGMVNVSGKYFGATPAGCSVMIGHLKCDPSKGNVWNDTLIECLAPPSGDGSHNSTMKVQVTTLSGPSNSNALTYTKCSFDNQKKSRTKYGVCLTDGGQTCNNNAVCNTTAVPRSLGLELESSVRAGCYVTTGLGLATCSCPAVCQNGVLNHNDCSCTCANGWSSAHRAVVPNATTLNTHLPGAVCAQCDASCTDIQIKVQTPAKCGCQSCGVSCGGLNNMLNKKVQTSSKCACEFNMLHLIWIVGGGVMLIVGAGFAVYKCKTKPQLGMALLSHDKHGDEEQEDREESAVYV